MKYQLYYKISYWLWVLTDPINRLAHRLEKRADAMKEQLDRRAYETKQGLPWVHEGTYSIRNGDIVQVTRNTEGYGDRLPFIITFERGDRTTVDQWGRVVMYYETLHDLVARLA